MEFKLDSYCGLYCGACFIMISYRQNRSDCLPDEWISPIHNMEIKCHGCKSELVFENCRGCRIRKCAQSRTIEFCNECSEFPCELINNLKKLDLPHHYVAICCLENIKNMSRQEWLKQQELRWMCSTCGAPFSWYEKTCIKCGADLFNSVQEKESLLK